jgi:small conductance mechanosensitive channel
MDADPVWKRRILEPPRVERVESIDETGITLKVLGTVRASDQWSASGEFRKRLLAAFREHGIDMAQQNRVVFTGEGGTRAFAGSGPTDGDPAE